MDAEAIFAADMTDIYVDQGVDAIYAAPGDGATPVRVTRRRAGSARPGRDGSYVATRVWLIGLQVSEITSPAVGASVTIAGDEFTIEDIDVERSSALQTICVCRGA